MKHSVVSLSPSLPSSKLLINNQTLTNFSASSENLPLHNTTNTNPTSTLIPHTPPISSLHPHAHRTKPPPLTHPRNPLSPAKRGNYYSIINNLRTFTTILYSGGIKPLFISVEIHGDIFPESYRTAFAILR